MAKDQSHYNRIAAIFFLLIGIFFAFYARTVEIGTWNEPGPGFLPFWAGIILGVMAAGSPFREVTPERLAGPAVLFPASRFLEKGPGDLPVPDRL